MIFISYSSLDEQIAQQIRNMLEANGVQCWMAPWSIGPGKDYAEEIPPAIRSCSAFLLLLTDHAQRSVFVPKELDMALGYRKIVVPLHLDEAGLMESFVFRLNNVQRIEAYARLDSAYVELLKRLNEIGLGSGDASDALRQESAYTEELTAFDFFDAGHTEETRPVPDLKKALGWYRYATAMGFAPAYTAAGRVCLAMGRHGEAAKHLEKAVDAAQAESYALLGRLLEKGLGVERDVKRAVRLYNQGWRMNSPEAACELARVYLAPPEGSGLAADPQKALKLFEFAVGKGYQEAEEIARELLPEKEKKAFLARLGLGDTEADAILLQPAAQRAKGAIDELLRRADAGDAQAMVEAGLYFACMTADGEGMRAAKADYPRSVDYLLRAGKALEENAGALYLLGFLYSGRRPEVALDAEKAVHYLTLAAEKDFADAMYCLGYGYALGYLSGAPDYERAKEWYLRAVSKGHVGAMFALGTRAQQGHFTDGKPDYPFALEWLTRAAEAGNINAMRTLALGMLKGLYTDGAPDVKATVAWYERAIAKGSVEAANALGRIYLLGAKGPAGETLVEISYEKALPVLERARKLGSKDVFVLSFLGYLYSGADGRMTPQPEKALELLTQTARGGDGFSLWKLGHMHQTGLLGKADYPAAMAWYEKGIEKGSVDAANALGRLYLLGAKGAEGETLVEISYEKALPVLERARELGSKDVFVLSFLGYLYSGADGHMTPQPEKALELLTQTAETGDGFSLWKLGHIHHTGVLGKKDYAKALDWYTQAQEAGYSLAEDSLTALEQDMLNQ